MDISGKNTDQRQFNKAIATGTAANFEVSRPLDLSVADGGELTEIRDCHFQGLVSLSDYEAKRGVTFTNCIFDTKLIIQRCKFSTYLKFVNCIFKSELVVDAISYRLLEFSGGSCARIHLKGKFNAEDVEESQFQITDGVIERLDVNCKQIYSEFNVLGGTFNDIFFSDVSFFQTFNFVGEKLSYNLIVFDSCAFTKRVDFKKSLKGNNSLLFYRTTFNHMLHFHEGFNCESLSLSGIVAKLNVSIIANGNIGDLTLSDCDFVSSFDASFYGDQPRSVHHNFSCNLSGFIRGNLIFEEIIVSSISLEGSNFGNIMFRKTDTHLITINNFQNNNRLTFANLQFRYNSHHLIIIDSNLEKTEFVNVDFKKFKEIVIAKSEVSNLILSNCKLPEEIRTSTSDPRFGYVIKDDEKISEDIYHRENFRQLKMAMEKQGNREAALRFKAKEMHHLRLEMKFGWDKVLLYLNYFSNRHGLSWIQGVKFTIGASYVLFLLYACSKPGTLISPFAISPEKWNPAISLTLNDFLDYLSSFPLYRNQSDQAISWKTHLVILLSRIFIGYGVYQTISAFQKFGGKS